MAYKAFLNGDLFFQTDAGTNEYLLTSAELDLCANESGTFLFKVPPSNVAYTEFHMLIDYVDVYRDDDLIFSGRVYSIRQTLDTQLEIECEGLLTVLKDSIIRPFIHDDTVENLVINLLEQHNGQVGTDKQITARNITIDDRSMIAYRDYQEYKSTIDRLNTLQYSFGGYMSVSRISSGLVLDWVQNYTTDSDQEIKLKSNLIDITREENSAEIITVLIPLGAQLDDEEGMISDARLTVAGVNDGLDYIEADSAYIERYGRIVGVMVWDDVTLAENLLVKGRNFLNSVLQSKLQINVTAVDLADAGYDVESFRIGQRIKVTSEPHDIDGMWFECTAQNLDLLHPANNQLTLGAVEYGYIRTKRRQDEAAISGLVNANYLLNQSVKGVNQDLIQRISNFESTIEQLPESITTDVLETVTNQYGALIQTIESSVQQLSDSFTVWFGESGRINTWFEFDSDFFKIRKNAQSVYSRQDNDSYEFVDQDGNTLLELNEEGMTAPTANISGQLKFTHGETGQWAIRKGAYISSLGGVNLDDVWIG